MLNIRKANSFSLILIIFFFGLAQSNGLGQELALNKSEGNPEQTTKEPESISPEIQERIKRFLSLKESEDVSPEIQERIKRIFSMGISYYRRGKYEEALSAFQIVSSLDPENKEIEKYINLAQEQIRNQQEGTEAQTPKEPENVSPEIQQRIKRLLSLKDSEPVSPEIQERIKRIFSMGISYYRRGKYEEALSAFQIVSSLDPENKEIEKYINLAQEKIGEILLEEEKTRQGAAQKITQKRIYDLYAAGLYAIQYNRFDDAIKYFQEVLKFNPHHEGAWSNIVTARTELERQKKTKSLEEVWVPKKPPVIEKAAQEEKAKEMPSPEEVTELQEQERRQRALLAEEEQESQLSEIYAYAQKLLNCARFEEAEIEFQKVESVNPKYRNTPFFLADIYKVKEAEKREKEPSKYILGADDVLQINVLGHAELSSTVTVEPGGEIILPLVKEVVMANGLTKEELAEKIKEVYEKYVKEPEVQIVITGYYSKKWYILGEVGGRGEYPLGKTNLTLMEALYRAGLPLEGVAAMRRVILIKPHKTNPKYRAINVFDILYYGRLQDNVRIEPGDIIYVPKTVLSKFTTMMNQLTTPVSNIGAGFDAMVSTSDSARKATPFKEVFGATEPDKKTSTTTK